MTSLLRLTPYPFCKRYCFVPSCSIKKKKNLSSCPCFLSIILTSNPSGSPIGYSFKINQNLTLLTTCTATKISKLDLWNTLTDLLSSNLVPTVDSSHSSQSELGQSTHEFDHVASFFIKLQ